VLDGKLYRVPQHLQNKGYVIVLLLIAAILPKTVLCRSHLLREILAIMILENACHLSGL